MNVTTKLNYAILTVHATWDAGSSVGFTEQDYHFWRDKIDTGCEVLIYKASPISANIAKGFVPDSAFVPISEATSPNVEHVLNAMGQPATYALPVKITYYYSKPVEDYVIRERIDRIWELGEYRTAAVTPVDVDIFRVMRQPE